MKSLPDEWKMHKKWTDDFGGISPTFNVEDLSPYVEDDELADLRANPLHPGEDDADVIIQTPNYEIPDQTPQIEHQSEQNNSRGETSREMP